MVALKRQITHIFRAVIRDFLSADGFFSVALISSVILLCAAILLLEGGDLYRYKFLIVPVAVTTVVLFTFVITRRKKRESSKGHSILQQLLILGLVLLALSMLVRQLLSKGYVVREWWYSTPSLIIASLFLLLGIRAFIIILSVVRGGKGKESS